MYCRLISSHVCQSLTRITNLEKLKDSCIRVHGLRDLFDKFCKQLAQNLVEVLSEKTTKYFTLEFLGFFRKVYVRRKNSNIYVMKCLEI